MREDIKKRREKYKNVVTPAMRIFHDNDMLVERKVGMDFAQYKSMRRLQNRTIKRLIKQPVNTFLASVMRPVVSFHLLNKVYERRLINAGHLEEVKPITGFKISNFFTKLFNFFRSRAYVPRAI